MAPKFDVHVQAHPRHRYKAGLLDSWIRQPAFQQEERGWGGREGYMEEGTLGSALRSEEVLEDPFCR